MLVVPDTSPSFSPTPKVHLAESAQGTEKPADDNAVSCANEVSSVSWFHGYETRRERGEHIVTLGVDVKPKADIWWIMMADNGL